ncbi:MAG: Pyridoxal biosynthesis lyase pdxS [Firmicutes bacterium]|nr:Pyridoxal biosynthesis lyase pdxS [Bacillota bacterium]
MRGQKPWRSAAADRGRRSDDPDERRAGYRKCCGSGQAHPDGDERDPSAANDGIFVGSGIFKSGDPAKRAKAIVAATTYYQDAKLLGEISRDLGEAMVGIEIDTIPPHERMQERGW